MCVYRDKICVSIHVKLRQSYGELKNTPLEIVRFNISVMSLLRLGVLSRGLCRREGLGEINSDIVYTMISNVWNFTIHTVEFCRLIICKSHLCG